MKSKKKVSIITPTYNRGNLLKNVYESLKKQSNRNFEWIIIDDGSTDDTESVVKKILDAHDDFDIFYEKKENGGKHTALNEAHKYIQGEYVLILDSDDTLIANAVEQILANWEKYKSDSDIGVITFLRGKSIENPICYVKNEKIPLDLLKHKRVCVYGNDCCEVIRSDLFKKYPFPVFEGEKFMSEGVLWHRVGLTHKCIYINRVIYICEYLEGGLTKSGKKLRINNPLGGMLNSVLNMDKKNYFILRIKNAMLYDCYGFFAKFSPLRILTNEKEYRVLKAICLVPGFFIYKYWKKKYS